MSPYGAHHTADDRAGGAGDEQARSRAKRCEQCLAREGPNRKKRGASVVDRNRFDITFPLLFFATCPRKSKTPHWLKIKNPAAPAVKREAEEDWGGKRWTRGRRS